MEYLVKQNKLYKYNQNIMVISDYQSEVDFCVDEKGFTLINAINEEKHFSLDSNILVVNNKARIKLLQSNLPNFNTEFNAEIDVSLESLLKALEFIDKKSFKRELSGVYVNSKGTIVGTDSFKLFIINKGVSDESVILTEEFIKEFKHLKGNVVLKFNSTCACIKINGKEIYGRLIVGKYPDVSKLVLSGDVYEEFDTAKFSEISKVGRLVGGDINVYFNNGKVLFEGDNNYEDSFTTQIVKYYINFEYIELVLKCFEKPLFSYVGELKPLYFKEKDVIALILPKKRGED